MIDSDNERSVSFRCNLMLGGGGVAGKGLSFGDGGGFGSFLCVPRGLFGRSAGLGAGPDFGAGVGDSNADAVAAATDFVGVW